MAATCGQLVVVEILLSRRVDVQAHDYSNRSALYYAETNEHAAIASLLRRYGARD